MSVTARDYWGNRAIKGKIMAANIQYWVDGHMKRVMDMDPGWYPYQINNMSEWLTKAIHALGASEFVQCMRTHPHAEQNIEFTVNDYPNGDELCVKSGYGRSHNKFSYTVYPSKPVKCGAKEVRIDILIHAKSHVQIYLEKKRDAARNKPTV